MLVCLNWFARFFVRLQANKRQAVVVLAVATVVFGLASALLQLYGLDNRVVALSSLLLLAVGLAGQLLGLLALMKKP